MYLKLINYLERLLIRYVKRYIYFMSSWLTINVIMFGSAILKIIILTPPTIIYHRFLKRVSK